MDDVEHFKTEAEEGYLHVTRLRVFTREEFNPDYFTPAHRRQVKKWLGELDEVHPAAWFEECGRTWRSRDRGWRRRS